MNGFMLRMHKSRFTKTTLNSCKKNSRNVLLLNVSFKIQSEELKFARIIHFFQAIFPYL